jgi:hypothetical protein
VIKLDREKIKEKIQKFRKSGKSFIIVVRTKCGIVEFKVKLVVAEYFGKFQYAVRKMDDTVVFVNGRDIITVI